MLTNLQVNVTQNRRFDNAGNINKYVQSSDESHARLAAPCFTNGYFASCGAFFCACRHLRGQMGVSSSDPLSIEVNWEMKDCTAAVDPSLRDNESVWGRYRLLYRRYSRRSADPPPALCVLYTFQQRYGWHFCSTAVWVTTSFRWKFRGGAQYLRSVLSWCFGIDCGGLCRQAETLRATWGMNVQYHVNTCLAEIITRDIITLHC